MLVSDSDETPPAFASNLISVGLFSSAAHPCNWALLQSRNMFPHITTLVAEDLFLS